MTIITKVESARGCGYRKKGGLYFVTDGRGKHCGKLPIELNVCPCCGEGIKFSRGFTWVTGALIGSRECDIDPALFEIDQCGSCPFNVTDPNKKFGLMWVGEKFYSPDAFTIEAAQKGISKRIASIPNNFKVGETWVWLAHIKAIKIPFTNELNQPCIEHRPGIFYAFRPTRIEYVITGNETEPELDAMEKRGITLVHVVRDIDQQTKIFNDEQV